MCYTYTTFTKQHPENSKDGGAGITYNAKDGWAEHERIKVRHGRDGRWRSFWLIPASHSCRHLCKILKILSIIFHFHISIECYGASEFLWSRLANRFNLVSCFDRRKPTLLGWYQGLADSWIPWLKRKSTSLNQPINCLGRFKRNSPWGQVSSIGRERSFDTIPVGQNLSTERRQ